MFFGTPQNFVYMTSWLTGWRFTLNPSWVNSSLTTWEVLLPGGELSLTMLTSQLPSHLPLEKPAFFMYDSARLMSPFGFLRKSRSGPAVPPASSNPGTPGGM